MSDGQVLADLASVLVPAVEHPVLTLRRGVVQAVTGATVTVRLGGGTTDLTGIRVWASVSPAAGDVVELLANGADLRVVAKMA